MTDFIHLREYAELVDGLKARIEAARLSAARSVNRELLGLHWDIGAAIVEAQRARSWGDAVVESLAADLRSAFPGVTGFSARNLRSMRQFYKTYTAPEFWRQVVAEFADSGKIDALPENDRNQIEFTRQLVSEIPWGHHLHDYGSGQ